MGFYYRKSVNDGLTLRNWLIGHRIVEFEQNGKDRAAYGERLLQELEKRLASAGLKRVDMLELRRFRLLYTTYPQIRETATPELLARSRAFVYKVGADRRAAPRFRRNAPLSQNPKFKIQNLPHPSPVTINSPQRLRRNPPS